MNSRTAKDSESSPEDNSHFCNRPPSSEDWESIFNSMTDMVTIHDNDWNIVCANKAAQKILGLPAIAGPRTKCFQYYHGTGCPPEGCPSCQTYKTGEAASFELFEPHLNMFIEIRALPRFDAEGKLAGLIHIVRDITERKNNEEELERHRNHLEEIVQERTEKLRESEEKFRRLFESANDSIFIIDPATRRFLDVNENAAKKLGYSRDEILQLTLTDIYCPEDSAKNEAIIRELVEHGNVVFEHEHMRRDGSKIPVEVSSRVVEYGGQKVFQSIVRDISERKKAEEEREKLIAELQEALSKIKTLKGLIPICAWCKKIRDDKGYWKLLETYISEHSEADFTHGICPECQEKLKLEEEEEAP